MNERNKRSIILITSYGVVAFAMIIYALVVAPFIDAQYYGDVAYYVLFVLLAVLFVLNRILTEKYPKSSFYVGLVSWIATFVFLFVQLS